MKVLLCKDVKKLGWLGDIVEVNTGYARNYLLPQGLAKVATEANIRALANEKAQRSEQRLGERKRLEAAAAAVEGAEAVLAAKANEQGVLFGSVGAGQIAANLREQGFEVANEIVELEENIKHVGTHSVTLRFADELTATVSVVVVPEGGDLASLQAAEGEAGAAPQAEGQQKAGTEQKEDKTMQD
ncbi:MAG: 50S ribosomal protein L9 [Planctomycetota bacterium]|jgi:large subunit ribosomal protein L9